MTDQQKGAVHVYVDVPTHDRFLAYLKDTGLEKKTSLGCLLVSREFRLNRLKSSNGAMPAAPTGAKKISVYLGEARRLNFETHAAPMPSSEALSRLVWRELEECWLVSALEWSGSD